MPSTDPIPTPPTPNASWLNTFWQQNQIVLDRILFVIVSAILAGVFHIKISDVQSTNQDTQQAIHEVKDVQAKNVAVEVRGNATDVQALKDVVLTQPTTQPSK